MINGALFFHNSAAIFSAIGCMAIGTLVLIKNPRKGLNISFFFVNVSITLFYISHLLGVNASSATEALSYFQYNWVNILIVMFSTHFILATIGEEWKQRYVIIFVYATGIILSAYFLIFPNLLIESAIPKLYLPFYYERGALYTFMRVYVAIIPLYFTYKIFKYYLISKGGERVRTTYTILGIFFGYIVGTSPVALIYNIPMNPAWGMFFGLYTMIFAYGILKHDALHITVVARRALIYGALVAIAIFSLIFLNVLNTFITTQFPFFPIWLIPSISGCIAVYIGGIVWNRIREIEKLKYEFITVVTHKFRTPLTAIRWSLNVLESSTNETERKEALSDIKGSEARLANLLEALVDVAHEDSTSFEYTISTENLEENVKEVVRTIQPMAAKRAITISFKTLGEIPLIPIDAERIRFVLQSIIENAINYSHDKGTIDITLSYENSHATIKVRDYGIGITKEELPHMFTKFYRGDKAKSQDTEGLGIALSFVKRIVVRHGGTIVIHSNGLGTGAECTITLPKK